LEEKISQAEKLSWEKELLGLYISEHPFTEFKKKLGTSVKRIGDLKNYIDEENIVVAGVVSSFKKIITKNNKSMLFVKIEDKVNNVEILIFPTILEKTYDLWQEGKVILCQGTISNKDQEIKVLVNTVREIKLESFNKDFENFREEAAKVAKRRKMFMRKGFVKKNNLNEKNIKNDVKQIFEQPFKAIIQKELSPDEPAKLIKLLQTFPGDSEVYLLDHPNNKIVKVNFKVKKSAILNIKIKEEFSGKIKVVDSL
jgi:DNA polymerase III alpha subunit